MSSAAPAGTGPAPSPASGLAERLRIQPKLPLIVGAAAIAAAAAAFLLWSRAPDYGVLYSNLSDRDGGAIIASLQQMNIPYKFTEGGGALLVQANKVPEARLRLAAQGLPKGGTVGFELMDAQKFGTSQFAEQVNYQRALEGELARSINSISAVESARVHLALPKPSLFVRDQKKPSASVVLSLHRGRSIDEGQVSAIVHLISSSVPELSAKSITVVDQAGNLLSAANAGTRGLDVSQLKYTQEIEQGYIRRIEAILQPILGAGNVHAQVAADIDFSIVENTDEKFRPNQEPGSAAIRSQQSSESNQGGNGPATGVPGALSNQPPPDPVAPITAPSQIKPGTPPGTAPGAQLKMSAELGSAGTAPRAAGPGGNSRRDVTTNYEVDRSIRHTQQGAGGIKRLSVAVVVNDRRSTGAGKRAALTAAELEQIRNLARQAMGFSAERGDSLNVVNSPFAADTETPELPLWRQPETLEVAKSSVKYLLLGLLALYMWLAVLRPLLRKHLQPAPAAAFTANAADGDITPGLGEAASAQAQALEKEQRERREQRHQANLQYAQDMAAKEPAMVAMLIKHWTEKNGG